LNKLRVLFLTAATAAVMTTTGQSDELPLDSSRFGDRVVGFYVGVSASQFTDDSWNMRYGPEFGAFMVLNLTDLLALQPELAYVSKGGKWEEGYSSSGASLGTNADIRLGYVQFAILARANQPLSQYRDEHNFRPKLLAGFSVNIKVNSSTRRSPPPDFKDTEFSFIFGGGFDQRIGVRRCLTADFRYEFGLTNASTGLTCSTVHFLLGMTL
jgi:hypothetical protein